MLYRKSIATWFFLDEMADIQPCEVRIDADKIILAFGETGNLCSSLWRGVEKERGHFLLDRQGEGYGQAALHRFEGGGFLDGFWTEDDDEGIRGQGMFRIELKGDQKPEKGGKKSRGLRGKTHR